MHVISALISIGFDLKRLYISSRITYQKKKYYMQFGPLKVCCLFTSITEKFKLEITTVSIPFLFQLFVTLKMYYSSTFSKSPHLSSFGKAFCQLILAYIQLFKTLLFLDTAVLFPCVFFKPNKPMKISPPNLKRG